MELSLERQQAIKSAVTAIVPECYLQFAGATMEINIEGSECEITFDHLMTFSQMFGTRDINFGFERGHAYSEYTFDEGRGWITISGITKWPGQSEVTR